MKNYKKVNQDKCGIKTDLVCPNCGAALLKVLKKRIKIVPFGLEFEVYKNYEDSIELFVAYKCELCDYCEEIE
jgi:hypothetical protein